MAEITPEDIDALKAAWNNIVSKLEPRQQFLVTTRTAQPQVKIAFEEPIYWVKLVETNITEFK